ncbi:UNVERIFIED_CONTAM: hypothetical protein ITH36_24855 [Salmonella enterica subsp. enterica serovar Weltevreden]
MEEVVVGNIFRHVFFLFGQKGEREEKCEKKIMKRIEMAGSILLFVFFLIYIEMKKGGVGKCKG